MFTPTSPGRTDIAPLDGVRVADLTWVWAGPFSTMQLAYLGADVVKVESHTRIDVVRRLGPHADGIPGTDTSGYFHQYNQGKRGIDLDLTTTADRATFESLVATADVVVDNMRAGALARMGYDDARLAAINPHVIISSLTGFGDAGPDRDRTAYGAIINCLSGVAAITGHPGGGPVDLQLSLADPCAGLHGAIGMLAALYRRRTTGVTERVDCTMVEAWIAAFPWGVLTEAAGHTPRAVGDRDDRWCPNVVARCAGDDEWVAVAVGDDDQWARLAAAIGRPELITDERFATAAARHAHVDDAEGVVAAWVAERDAREAADVLRAAGVPAARVARLDDVMADEHLAARRFFTELDHPVVGRRRLAGVPFHASRSPVGPRRPAPCLGEHTAQVRAELGEQPATCRSAGVDGHLIAPRAAGVAARSIDEVAGHPALVADVAPHRHLRRADVLRVRAARVEHASGRRMRGAGDLAGEGDAMTDAVRRRHHLRLRRAQCGRVRVQRPLQHVVGGPELHQVAEVHHPDAVGDVGHDGQVVADEQQRQPELGTQPGQHVEHLGLHRHVQGGDGLVAHEQVGPQHERERC